MPITRTPWIDDDGTGTTGTIINNAEKQLLYNQIDELCGLGPTAIPFASLVFFDSFGAVAASNYVGAFVRHGAEIHLRITLTAAPVTGGTGAASIGGFPWDAIPGPSVVCLTSLAVGSSGWGPGVANATGNVVTMNRMDFSAWPASAGGYFYIDMLFPVN
jgi:hypothetical protein